MSTCGIGTKGCGCSEASAEVAVPVARRPLEIELLYLDLETCDRCRSTGDTLREAVEEARKILAPSGVEVTLREILVTSGAQARRLAFRNSPTIRSMGRDLSFEVKENACGSCSEIAGRDITCRAWTWQGKEYAFPPKAMLVDAILRDAYVHPGGQREDPLPLATLPENLEDFFQGATRRWGPERA